MTLQPQFTMLRTVPSTVVACWPWTALLNAGAVPRFCALAARGATRFAKRMRLKANIRAARTQFVVSGRKRIAVDAVADTGERRQKAGAVLIRFLSWTRLLRASASRQRVWWNRRSVK